MMNEDDARKYRLRIRAQIRAHNRERPRCAGCGNDMLVFDPGDVVTDAMMTDPDYLYLGYLDYRPGDLICFWCVTGALDSCSQRFGGRA